MNLLPAPGSLNALLVELKARGFKVVHMISKTPTTTLPEYDAIADQEFFEDPSPILAPSVRHLEAF